MTTDTDPLTITLHVDEALLIGDDVLVTVVAVQMRGTVTLRVAAPLSKSLLIGRTLQRNPKEGDKA